MKIWNGKKRTNPLGVSYTPSSFKKKIFFVVLVSNAREKEKCYRRVVYIKKTKVASVFVQPLNDSK